MRRTYLCVFPVCTIWCQVLTCYPPVWSNVASWEIHSILCGFTRKIILNRVFTIAMFGYRMVIAVVESAWVYPNCPDWCFCSPVVHCFTLFLVIWWWYNAYLSVWYSISSESVLSLCKNFHRRSTTLQLGEGSQMNAKLQFQFHLAEKCQPR